MEPPFAFADQLGAWVGEEIPTDDPRAVAVLTAASVLVQSYVGADVAAAWEEAPADVKQVVIQSAARVWFNPQALENDAIDDYRRGWGKVPESGVYLTSGERDILSPYRSGPKGVWTLSTTRDDPTDDQYLDVVNAGTPAIQEEQMPFLPPGM